MKDASIGKNCNRERSQCAAGVFVLLTVVLCSVQAALRGAGIGSMEENL